MFNLFPPIPISSVPKIPIPTEVQKGSSTSSSKVIVCVNNKCLTRESNSASGSSYLKVSTVTKDGQTTTKVEENVVTEGQEPARDISSKITVSVKSMVDKIVNYLKKYLTKI